MKTFIFFLYAPLWSGSRCKKTKRIKLEAKDWCEATAKIKEKYPEWEVSMFWEQWK